MGKDVSATLMLAMALALPGAVDAKKGPPCPPGRYLVAGESLIPGGDTPDVIEIRADGTIDIASGCPAREAKIKGRTKGTSVRTRWPKDTCRDLRGKVRFKAKSDAECTMLTGRLRLARRGARKV